MPGEMRQVCPKTGSREGGIGEEEDDTTGRGGSDSRNVTRNARQLSLSLFFSSFLFIAFFGESLPLPRAHLVIIDRR